MKKLLLASTLLLATAGAGLAQAPAANDPHHPPQVTTSAPQSPATPSVQAQQAPQGQAQPGQTSGQTTSAPTTQAQMQAMMQMMQGMMQMMQGQTQQGQGQARGMPSRPMQGGMMMDCPMMQGTPSGSAQETSPGMRQGMMQMMGGMMQMMQMMHGQMQGQMAPGQMGPQQPAQPGK
jgi:hypothetical protein